MRSIRNNYKFVRIEEEMINNNIDILRLAEVKQPEVSIIKTKKHKMFSSIPSQMDIKLEE